MAPKVKPVLVPKQDSVKGSRVKCCWNSSFKMFSEFSKIYLLLGYLTNANAQYQGLYSKVPSTFPSTISSRCLQHRYIVSSIWRCLTLCSQTPSCKLACVNGETCYLYKAYVSTYLNPTFSSGTTVQYDSCYSSWYFSTDLTTQISSIQTQDLFNVDSSFYDEKHALDGYYCSCHVDPHFKTGYLYNISTPLMGWMEVDFGSVKRVSQVLIVMRDQYSTTYFNGIEVRVGNISGAKTQDFRGNALLGSYLQPQPAPQFAVITFQEFTPLYGRYVSICNTLNKYLVFPELKIIG